jgi:hypothetical protein
MVVDGRQLASGADANAAVERALVKWRPGLVVSALADKPDETRPPVNPAQRENPRETRALTEPDWVQSACWDAALQPMGGGERE